MRVTVRARARAGPMLAAVPRRDVFPSVRPRRPLVLFEEGAHPVVLAVRVRVRVK